MSVSPSSRLVGLSLLLALAACGGPRAADDGPGMPPDPAPPAEYVQDGTYVTPPPTRAEMPPSTRPRLLGFLFKRSPGDTFAGD